MDGLPLGLSLTLAPWLNASSKASSRATDSSWGLVSKGYNWIYLAFHQNPGQPDQRETGVMLENHRESWVKSILKRQQDNIWRCWNAIGEDLSCSIAGNLPQVGSAFVVFLRSTTDNLLVRRPSPTFVPATKNYQRFLAVSHFTGYLLVDIRRLQSLSWEVMRTMVPCRTGFRGWSTSTTSNSSNSSNLSIDFNLSASKQPPSINLLVLFVGFQDSLLSARTQAWTQMARPRNGLNILCLPKAMLFWKRLKPHQDQN